MEDEVAPEDIPEHKVQGVTDALVGRLPEGVTGNFTATCRTCGATMRFVNAAELPHTCDPAVARAWDKGWAARAEYADRRDVPLDWPARNPYR